MSKVCIDAGHYGSRYNHSPVVAGYYESDRMWVLAELLSAALKKRGVTVVQTRTNKASDLALASRGKKASGCDLFLSLHSNAANSESVDYPVAYVFRDDKKIDLDERSKEIGLKLAKVVEQLMDTRQPARTATRGSDNDRDGNGVKDDEYYGVLHGAKLVKVPGVILEHSFHTNRKATEWLMSDANLAKLAEAEADCIADWLGTKKPAEKPQQAAPKLQVARHKSKVYAKTYTTKTDLNMRTGAGVAPENTVITTLKKGAKFTCYGYYNLNGSSVWLYGVADGKTGYCSKAYLK